MWRTILPKLAALLDSVRTRKRSYRRPIEANVDFQWNAKLWTHNFFRLLELVFWVPCHDNGDRIIRRYSALVSVNGRYHQIALTLEQQLAQLEIAVRSAFRPMGFKLVLVPQAQLAGFGLPVSLFPYRLAIAHDNDLNGVSNNNSPATFVTTGSNVAVRAGTLTDITATNNGNLTSMTYNGTTLTLFSSNGRYPSDRWLVNAIAGGITAGSATLSEAGSTFNRLQAVSYTGSSSTQPDSQASSTNGGSSTASLVLATNVVVPNCWLAAMWYGGGSYAAGTGTLRSTGVGDFGMSDSNATVGTGSQSLTLNQANDFITAGICSIAPAAAATAPVITSDIILFNGVKR